MSKKSSRAKRRKRRTAAVSKSGPVWRQTAEQATLAKMPRYNAHACGTGAHGDAKYNRARQKRDWQREMNREGTRTRGFLLGSGQGLPSRSKSPVRGRQRELHLD